MATRSRASRTSTFIRGSFAHRPKHRALGSGAIILGLVGGLALACSDATGPDLGGITYGPSVTIGAGTARSYVVRDGSGDPTELGVALSDGALTGLPSTKTEYVLALPSEAAATPYTNVGVNWQPTGHPPVFMVPHFDAHFYTISEADRAAQTTADPLYATKVARDPEADLIPAGYTRGGTDPQMGTHWVDRSTPVFSGASFTKIFVYGSFDGAFVFGEPMVTLALLASKPAIAAVPVNQPARYGATGFQPTTYSVGFDAATNEHRIALTGLVKR